MSSEIHVRRLVLPESLRDLRFRRRIEREFGHHILATMDDNNLHTTIASISSDKEGLEATAQHLINLPDASDNQVKANVIGAQPFGYNRLAGVAAFGLALDHPSLTEDRNHFLDIDTGAYHDDYTPHVTLFRAREISGRDAHIIADWIEALAPATIALSAITASTVRRRMRRSQDDEPRPSRVVSMR